MVLEGTIIERMMEERETYSDIFFFTHQIQDNISDDKQVHNPVLVRVSMVDTRDASSSKNLSNPMAISLFFSFG